MSRMRSRALWLAIGLTLGAGAAGFAASPLGAPAEVPPIERPDDTGPPPHAVAGGLAVAQQLDDEGEDGERPLNHGFYVSQAAQCQDVEDPETELSFTAPDDCEGEGNAHGKYVSEVARSRIGKGDHPGRGPNGQPGRGPNTDE